MSSTLDSATMKSVSSTTGGNYHIQGMRAGHVYLRPTRRGVFYLLLTLLMLVSSLNYQNNLGILTTLFFVICLLFSGLQTRRLLQNITININKIEPVFCSTPAHAIITITKFGQLSDAQILLRIDGGSDSHVHMTPAHEQTLSYAIPTTRRGEHIIQHVSITTRYPFGVIQARMTLAIEHRFIVYPDPMLAEHQMESFQQQQRHDLQDLNQTDFAGLRGYTPGDPFKHINWKAVASARGLYVNIFSSNVHSEGWIDWDDYAGLDTEQRLSLMTRAVIEHEKGLYNYGLRLPGTTIRPHCGVNHMRQCHTAMACYGRPAAFSKK